MRRLYDELPLFFLSGTQTVTEHFPFHVESTFRLPLLQFNLMTVHLASFHKTEKNGDSLAICFLIREFHTNNSIIQLQHTAFNAFSVTKDIHQHICIPIRSPQKKSGRVLYIKFLIFFIIKEICKRSRTLVTL